MQKSVLFICLVLGRFNDRLGQNVSTPYSNKGLIQGYFGGFLKVDAYMNIDVMLNLNSAGIEPCSVASAGIQSVS